MNIIGGLDSYYSGNVIANGKNLRQLNDKQLDEYRRKDIGFIFQSFHLISHLTVLGNVLVALNMTSMSKQERKGKAKSLLKSVGLTSQMKKYPSQLSGGQQQRVSIARALASNPKILIADEPTGALDQTNTDEVMQILNKIAQQGKLVLTVTHSLKVAKRGTRIVHIENGKVNEDKQLRKSYGSMDKSSAYKSRPLASGALWHMTFDNIKRHLSQNILTIVGTAIGLIAVLLILGLGKGVKGYVDNQITSQINPHVAEVTHKNVTNTKPFNNQDIKKIKSTKGVTKVSKGYSLNSSQYNYQGHKGKIARIATDAPMVKKTDIKYGNYPKGDSVLIPQQIAKRLNKKHEKSLIGKKIRVVSSTSQDSQTQNTAPQAKGTAKIAGIMKGQAGGLVATYSFAGQMLKSVHMKIQPQNLMVSFSGNTEKINQTQNRINALKLNGKKSYQIMGTSSNILKMVDTYVNLIVTVLSAIAGVSLLVATVMIIAILFISVNERTREIGVLRALGASKKNIRHLFIDQAVLLGLISTAGATVISYIIEPIINKFVNGMTHYSIIQITPVQVIIILVITLIIHLIASVLPAWKASRLDPIDCLNK